ncbi:hypothetical protein ACHAPQ_011186 [Fusarium lateritium]
MKFTSIIVSTLAVGQGLAADFNLRGTYTDELVNVGNLDSFWSVWNRMYDVSDNNGGLSDHTTWQYTGSCNSKNSKPRTSVRVQLDGQWGVVGRGSGWQMRDALIQAMWATVQAAGQQNQYPVYTDCSGFTWQESTPRNPNAACGRATTKKIYYPCEYMVECQQFSWVANGVEYSHSSTQKWRNAGRFNVFGYLDCCIGLKDAIFGNCLEPWE